MCKLRLNLSGLGANKEVRTEKGMHDAAQAKLDDMLYFQRPSGVWDRPRAFLSPAGGLLPQLPTRLPVVQVRSALLMRMRRQSQLSPSGWSWLPPCGNLCVELGAQGS